MALFGNKKTVNTNLTETTNQFDQRVITTNANRTSGAQAEGGSVSATDSVLDLSNRSTSNTNITSLDGGAIDKAAKVTIAALTTSAERDKQTVDAMGSLSSRVVDGAFAALKGLGERLMGTADSATQSAYSLAGQGMRTVGDAKAPEAAITKTALYVAGGLGAAMVIAVIFSRGKK